MKRLLIVLSFASLALNGCGGEGIKGTSSSLVFESAKAMVADTKARITQISIQDFKTRMENEEEYFILIDVREADEFEAGSIPGAFNIARGSLEFKIVDEDFWDLMGMYVPEKDEEIIIYSRKGRRGALATESLTRLGYKNVKNLIGGWIGWSLGPEAVEEEEEKKEESGCG